MVLRFAGFQLDRPRAELRGPDGEAIKLRPKTFGMLTLFATNPGRVLSKQELMDAVWPNIHVGDDSLFQCIREIRTALGDDRRQLVRLVSGRGYLFEAEVFDGAAEPICDATPSPAVPVVAQPVDKTPPEPVDRPAEPVLPAPRSRRRGTMAVALAAVSVLCGLATVFAIRGLHSASFGNGPPTVAVMPITAPDGDAMEMAANVTMRLADGLAKIETIRVAALPMAPAAAKADYIVSGELHKSGSTSEPSWDVRMRMTRTATGEVVWAAPATIAIGESDLPLQQSRLTASIGHPLALRLSALLGSSAKTTAKRGLPPGSATVVIEQATAAITHTTRERFTTAEAMLQKALVADPDNVDLAVSLAALQLRGIQMVWYSPAASAAAESRARAILEHALQLEPTAIPVLEAYCRFLNATNEFVESLVACARTLNFDPWNGLALYHIGLAQLQLGRFDDAIATFTQANRFDTPLVSRWTWPLGLGMTYLLMGRSSEALPWLLKSIAITPASGRPYILLAAAYQKLGQPDEAKAAMDKALALRPGSTVSNVKLPVKNASAEFLAAGQRIDQALVAAGLPYGD